MHTRPSLIALALALTSSIGTIRSAQPASGAPAQVLHVNASVRNICYFDTPVEHLHLSYDPVTNTTENHNPLTAFTYNCIKGVKVYVSVGPGNGGGATGTSRWTMYDESNDPLNYVLYSDLQHECTDPKKAHPYKIDIPFEVGSGRGFEKYNRLAFNVCGQIEKNQFNAKPGTYRDTVTLTLSVD